MNLTGYNAHTHPGPPQHQPFNYLLKPPRGVVDRRPPHLGTAVSCEHRSVLVFVGNRAIHQYIDQPIIQSITGMEFEVIASKAESELKTIS